MEARTHPSSHVPASLGCWAGLCSTVYEGVGLDEEHDRLVCYGDFISKMLTATRVSQAAAAAPVADTHRPILTHHHNS